jgi:hypothetical protein
VTDAYVVQVYIFRGNCDGPSVIVTVVSHGHISWPLSIIIAEFDIKVFCFLRNF